MYRTQTKQHRFINSLTLEDLYIDYSDFINKTKLTDTTYIKKLYNAVFALDSDRGTKWYTHNSAYKAMGYWFDVVAEQYKIADDRLQKVKDKIGNVSENNVFNIGDIDEDIANYDEYKTSRVTAETFNGDINDAIAYANGKSLAEIMLAKIRAKIFKVVKIKGGI